MHSASRSSHLRRFEPHSLPPEPATANRSDRSRHVCDESRELRGVARADLMEVDDLIVDVVDDDPGPEVGAAGDEDVADGRRISRGSEAGKVAAVVVFHVEVRVKIDVDHVSAPPSGSWCGLISVVLCVAMTASTRVSTSPSRTYTRS